MVIALDVQPTKIMAATWSLERKCPQHNMAQYYYYKITRLLVPPTSSPHIQKTITIKIHKGRGRGGRTEPLEFFFFSIKPCLNKQLRRDYSVEGKMTMVTGDIIRSVDKTFLVTTE